MPELEPHEHRVAVEQRELSANLDRLERFLKSDTFKALAKEDQGLLEEQAGHMRAYNSVLQRRIKRFGV